MYIRHTVFKGDRVSIGGHCWIYPVYIIKDKSKILLESEGVMTFWSRSWVY